MAADRAAALVNRGIGSGLLWLAGLVVLAVVAFQLGVHHYEQTYCYGPEDVGDCDLGFLTGFLWGGATLLAYCVLTLVVARLRRRRTSS